MYQNSFSQPSQRFFKAVSKSTDEIVGFGQVEFLEKLAEPRPGQVKEEGEEGEEGEGDVDGEVKEGVASSPFPPSSDAFNAEFAMLYHGGMRARLTAHMSKRENAAGTLHKRAEAQVVYVQKLMILMRSSTKSDGKAWVPAERYWCRVTGICH